MAKLFVSFIHEEQDWAESVNFFLKNVLGTSLDSFMSSDKNAILAGEDWMTRIFEELKEAKVLVSMLSLESVKRPWINFEAGAAWMRDTKVIPVCFGGLEIDRLPKPYSNLQAVDIETYDGGYYLVSSIAQYLGLPRPKRPIFTTDEGRLALSTQDPEGNKKLFAPYRILRGWMELFKNVTKDPGGV